MGAHVQAGVAEYRLFEAMGETCGVLLWDPGTDQTGFRFREDWEAIDPEETETLRAIAADLPGKLAEMGREPFLAWIDDTLSNSFRVLPPQTTMAGAFDRTLQALFRRHVRPTVRKYGTHLPLLSLRACAGGLGPDMAARVDDWIPAEVPGRKALSDDLFVVRIEGQSMEPDIPDGSLCVFRKYYGGSRKGKIVLVQRYATFEDGGEVTVKRYDSTWEAGEQSRIRMQPDNPAYAKWDLKPGERWETLGEFMCVLEDAQG
jgi:SOS-response transcriptional repressor LexA